jgi:hypothetical protein
MRWTPGGRPGVQQGAALSPQDSAAEEPEAHRVSGAAIEVVPDGIRLRRSAEL